MKFKPKRIVIDTEAINDRISSRAVTLFPEANIVVIKDAFEVVKKKDFGKNTIILTHNKGKFIKNFTGVRREGGCAEKYIAAAMNCPFNCSYCYLSSYLNYRSIVIYTNEDKLIREVQGAINESEDVTLTTGEFSDSLAIEYITETTRIVLPLLAGTRARLELRTKTSLSEKVTELFDADSDRKESFRNAAAKDKTQSVALPEELKQNLVVTWTLEPQEAIEKEESGTAALFERIEAMKEVASLGIRVGIRFDPVIPFYFEETLYDEIIEAVSKYIPAKMIERVELGIVRFPGRLVSTIGTKRSGSNILKGEFIRRGDGKFVLIRPERIRIYKALISSIRNRIPEAKVVLSMEPEEVAEEVEIGRK